MINEENLQKLYEKVINGEELTTKELNALGFNSKDLKELVDTSKLERIKRGLYAFKDIRSLNIYGKILISRKEYGKSKECFEKCYELDPNNLSVCFQVFITSIKEKDYEKALEVYKLLQESDNKYYAIDLNYYLYLLSFITDLPSEYRLIAMSTTAKDILVLEDDLRYPDKKVQNRVRMSSLNKRFAYALKQLNEYTFTQKKTTIQEVLIKTLLQQVVSIENESKKLINQLLTEKDYEGAKKLLVEKSYQHNLSQVDTYTLKLLDMFEELKRTKKLPSSAVSSSNNIFEAIDNRNFGVAYQLSQEYGSKINSDNNSLSILLGDIVAFMKEATQEVHKEKEEIKKAKEEKKIEAAEVKLSTIISKLLNNEIKEAISDLKSYLKTIGKPEYEALIISLIELSILDRDLSFKEPMIALTLLNKGQFEIDSSEYLQEFYFAVYNKQFDRAKIYLSLIGSANKLGKDYIETAPLYKVLSSLRKSNNKEEYLFTDEEEKQEPNVETLDEEIEEEPEKVTDSIKEEPTLPRDSEREFIEHKHEEVLACKGIVLLKPMSQERIDEVISEAKNYSDMVAFVITFNSKARVVLRYRERSEEEIDIQGGFKESNRAYTEKRYEDCLNISLNLMKTAPHPGSSSYARIGLAYMKLNNIPKAIEYLTVATALSIKYNQDFDFSDLILRLEGGVDPDDVKPRVKVSEKELARSDIDNFYGLDNFYEINECIIATGLDVESACQSLGVSKDNTDLIKLIYAREYYINGDMKNGDVFLKSVEKSPDKTEHTVMVFEEIRKNKMFYSHREIRTERPQMRILKPKK